MSDVPRLLYDNRLADGVPTATTTAAGYSVLHLNDWREFTYWKAGSTATQYITVDCGSAQSADALGIGGHNLAAVGASVAVECSSDNFSSDTTVALAATAISDSGAQYLPFASQTKRYWRLKITGISSACYIGIVAIGEVLEFDQPIYGDYTPDVIAPDADVNVSDAGHMLGAMLGFTELRSRLEFQYISDGWWQNSFMPAWEDHLNKGLPAFFAPCYGVHPEDVFLYRVDEASGIDAAYQAGGVRRFGLALRGDYAVAYGYNLGDFSSLLNINWSSSTTSVTGAWNGGAWSGSLGLYVLVSDDVTKVATSENGFDWTARSAPNKEWQRVIWVDDLGLFVAVAIGDPGNEGVMTSPDGINWTLRTTPGASNDNWYDLAYSPSLGLIVAVGTSASVPVITSSDGISWSGHSAPWANLRGVTWSAAEAKFVAVETRANALESSNGTSWIERSLTSACVKVTYSSDLGQFVAVGEDSDEVNISTDGTSWTGHNISSNPNLTDVIWVSEAQRYFASGQDTATFDASVYGSEDGQSWSSVSVISSPPVRWNAIVWSPDLAQILALGDNDILIGTGVS